MAEESAKERIVRALLGPEVWPSPWTLSPDLHDHMQALGVLITNYNSLEFTLYFFFYHFLGPQAAVASLFVFSKLNNQVRVDAIERYVVHEKDEAVKERLEWFLAAYDVCTENRNFLAHAKLHGHTAASALIIPTRKRDQAVFKKPPRNAPERDNFTHLSVSELRQLAEEIAETDKFGFDLFIYLQARRTGGIYTFPEGRQERPSLPEIPPAPRALILSDSADQQGD